MVSAVALGRELVLGTDSQSPTTGPDEWTPQWSLVLPVYNQADHLQAVVESHHSALVRRGDTFEVLLVPNGCKDDSEQICADLATRLPDVHVVRCSTAGWGAAVRAGLQASRGRTVCYTNLARTTPDDLARILDHAVEYPDNPVKAVREIRDSSRRRWGSRLYNLEARALFGIRTSDVNGTPKAFPRHLDPLLHLSRNDDLIDLEFMAECSRHGYVVREVPIRSTTRHGGESTTRLKSAFRMYSGAMELRRSVGRRS